MLEMRHAAPRRCEEPERSGPSMRLVTDEWGVTLARVLDVVGASLVTVVQPAPDPEVDVRASVLWDPLEPLTPVRGGIALLIGASPNGVLLAEQLREAKRLGYVAAVVKRRGADLAAAAAAARGADIALLLAADHASWATIDSMLEGAITSQGPVGLATLGDVMSGDLFAVANAIASCVGAAITIEDLAWQVLAYSNVDGQPIDDCRRAAILGRAVEPNPEFQSEYQEVARSAGPVVIPQPRANGGYARVAVPVRAGGRLLGSIWAVSVSGADADRIADTLRDVAPIVAVHLMSLTQRRDLERTHRAELLASQLGVAAPHRAEASATLHDRLPVALLAFGPLDHSSEVLDEVRLTNLIALNAETMCRDASCAQVDEAIVVLLPHSNRFNSDRLEALASATVRAVQGLGITDIGCAYAESVASTEAVAGVRRELSSALRGMSRRGGPGVISVSKQGHLAVMQDLIEAGYASSARYIPQVRAILEHDREHETSYARTLGAHLDCFGDARKAAELTHMHHNSHRYRMRRIVEQFDLDLSDPEQRLVLWLQLRSFATTAVSGITLRS